MPLVPSSVMPIGLIMTVILYNLIILNQLLNNVPVKCAEMEDPRLYGSITAYISVTIIVYTFIVKPYTHRTLYDSESDYNYDIGRICKSQ